MTTGSWGRGDLAHNSRRIGLLFCIGQQLFLKCQQVETEGEEQKKRKKCQAGLCRHWMIIEKEEKKEREWSVSSPPHSWRPVQAEEGWVKVRNGRAVERKAFLSSLTLKKISQMKEGVHANVKASVITSRLVSPGWGLSWDLEGWGNTCLICEQERWGAFARAIRGGLFYMVISVCMGKKKELHLPLLGLCSSWVSTLNLQFEDHSHVDTAASQSLHLQCLNTDWRVAMHATAVSLNFTC